MKKFYTMISEVDFGVREYIDDHYSYFVNFPITCMVKKHVKKEMFHLVIVDSFQSEMSMRNIQLLIEELKSMFSDMFQYEVVNVSNEENVEGQIDLFTNVYKTIKPEDSIYFDITFGYKPIAFIVTMLCNYAEKILKNAKIEKIYCTLFSYKNMKYPHYVHKIIDVTTLYRLNSLINDISQSGVSSLIDAMINE